MASKPINIFWSKTDFHVNNVENRITDNFPRILKVKIG